jgi:hypothetical protein
VDLTSGTFTVGNKVDDVTPYVSPVGEIVSITQVMKAKRITYTNEETIGIYA